MVRETILTVDDLIYPVFVMEGEGEKVEISSMPGCYRFSLDLLLKEITEVSQLGINAVAIFPVIPEEEKQVRKVTTSRDWYRKRLKLLKS
jgi:porphobilinogen synthase